MTDLANVFAASRERAHGHTAGFQYGTDSTARGIHTARQLVDHAGCRGCHGHFARYIGGLRPA